MRAESSTHFLHGIKTILIVPLHVGTCFMQFSKLFNVSALPPHSHSGTVNGLSHSACPLSTQAKVSVNAFADMARFIGYITHSQRHKRLAVLRCQFLSGEVQQGYRSRDANYDEAATVPTRSVYESDRAFPVPLGQWYSEFSG